MERETKQRKTTTRMFIISLALILIAIVLFVVFNLKGEEKTSGDFSDVESTTAATCTTERIGYLLFDTSGATRKQVTTKVVANNKKIQNISLVSELYFDDKEAVIQSRDKNHFGLNKAFETDMLEPDAYDSMYSTFDDHYQVSLFVSSNGIDDKALKYFMLDGLDGKNELNYSDAIAAYEKLGMKCEESR